MDAALHCIQMLFCGICFALVSLSAPCGLLHLQIYKVTSTNVFLHFLFVKQKTYEFKLLLLLALDRASCYPLLASEKAD